ncbi:MAG: hypothetical protein LGR52_02200 [Candidatus Thiosymbion ectosymbiont of Robbea hypermnestra]|nr:hypothetical protein [Candidatus Thiosymbion ectosymbiont of Robbea hypermnestra]
MNRVFQDLRPTDRGKNLHNVRRQRKETLLSLIREEAPDVFLVELYPFGRENFWFEIDPVLDGMRRRVLPQAKVVCSLRDILVEKTNAADYEARVVRTLNRFFDALFIHADPKLVRLEETFSRYADIGVPVDYTGYVTPAPSAGARQRVRRQMGISPDDHLVVASAGGGKVGGDLLAAVLKAVPQMARNRRIHLLVFTGPYLSRYDFEYLQALAGPGTRVQRFTDVFPDFLAAADLSISMAGYNTSMNLLAAQTKALVWPFPQNREQGLRTRRLADIGMLAMLADKDLEPCHLAERIDYALSQKGAPRTELDLNGAATTARLLGTGIKPC